MNVVDCTNLHALSFRVRCKKNQEAEALLEMLGDLKGRFDLSNFVFVCDALNTRKDLVKAIALNHVAHDKVSVQGLQELDDASLVALKAKVIEEKYPSAKSVFTYQKDSFIVHGSYI